MPLISKTTILEFSSEEIENIIRAELIASGQAAIEDKINVSYTIQEVGGDDRMGWRGTDTVTKIVVTIEKAS